MGSDKNKSINLFHGPWLAFFAAALTFLFYLGALDNGFVNWDDPTYVYKNTKLGSFDWALIKWAFTTVVSGNWHPLAMISHGLDVALFGLNAKGHHFTSIFIHSINTLLVFFITKKLLYKKKAFQAGAAALITALLFGLHPTHVESVAWISERKDLLSALFFMISILFYLGQAEDRRRKLFYILSLFSFILALLSKPMAVTLPVVLLIIDIYRDGAFTRKTLVGKIPFFAISLIYAPVIFLAQKSAGAMGSIDSYPVVTRIFTAAEGFFFYIYKTIIPVNLAPYYPHPGVIESVGLTHIGAIIALIAITALVILLFKKERAWFSAWAYYVVTLLPVIGLVQIGAQAAADRYTYLPMISLYMLVAVGLSGLCARAGGKGRAIGVIFIVFIISISLGWSTKRQVEIWRDSVTLWSYEISLFPDTLPIAYTNRGIAYGGLGRIDDAHKDFDRAIEILPTHVKGYYNRAKVWSIKVMEEEAIADLTIAIELKPNYAGAYFNRGNSYARLGRYKKAIADYETALAIRPGDSEAMMNISRAYGIMGDNERAAEYRRRAKKVRER